ncbi:hypothetical protein POL68_39865 [Stigmatella sp. ncwal1]|uniref:Uncharacterized protein n=1 Tax=Stigmatella ashevillensis TaxID=2995309 RepID=A0ABT5DLX4_9BACT|nr:hypothetical protein [Stigmatella ashevillena]MDC0714674.1 hypothetical protein [Stigmatella ashevillena]
MTHMPYEDTKLGIHEDGPSRNAAPQEAPGRTPNSAEGKDEERRMPGGEPGKTPGSAEGEDEPSRRPSQPPY